MDIVDSQVHVFHKHTEQEALAAMDALGIAGVLIDELWAFGPNGTLPPETVLSNGAVRPLSPLAQAAAMKFPHRFSFLQRVSREDPDLPALFAMLAATPGCRAIRLNCLPRLEQIALAEGGFDELLKLARRYEFPVFVIIPGGGPEAMRKICRKFSDVQFILDHCGRTESSSQWDDVLTLSDCPNLAMKWSHPHHYFKDAGPYPFPGHRVQLGRAIESFGVNRLMWATDISADGGGVSWAELLFTIRDNPSLSLNDKEWLLGKTARTILKWDASPAHTNSPQA
ncbi:hypothetical protein AOQ72_16810 [Bradyrhizobium yuanmingense]|uniref:Amidohydrolase-related domain-containing protein n=1 Tax=Bradyrhizobium yuanmingense TaxID=108015 RepID=A0A0R3CM21_9BRAD|nr:amidohydrolase family protein [Bradyrhizobium yuanmingense]KRP98762.1 hypothetical protein AOQ72_16810 [Bradyrhizobium yuanmingense]